MKCVSLVGLLLLQAVYATKNITLSIDVPKENPADVSYVDGKAPEELKAGPSAKNITIKPKETIAQAAFIRSSNREIPKDDEIENEEFERFIKKYHSGPTIETVFVSTSPSPPAEDSEELNEESKTTDPQVEVFNRPSAKLQTFERSVAHPTLSSHILPPPEHHPTYAILNHGSDGYIFQPNGGDAGNEGFILQSNGGDGGQFVLTDAQGSGGEQQYLQFANLLPRTFNVAQNAVKTRTYEIRRPAIQKHYYDIEERVIVRPAGSVVVELDRPVAKVPTGETVIAVGGLTGTLVGNGFQQSSQGGISFANAFGLNGGGSQGGQVGVGIQQSGGGFDLSQGGLAGSGITYTSSVGLPSPSPSPGGSIGGFQLQQGSLGGPQGSIGFQQSQGSLGGAQGNIGFQQSQGSLGGGQAGSGITYTSSVGLPSPSPGGLIGGFQQSQGSLGGGQGSIGFQQSQGSLGGGQAGSGITYTSSVGLPGPSPSPSGSIGGFQQSQGSIGGSQGGIGIQQSQGGVTISTTTPSPNGSPTSTTVVVGTQQQQGIAGSGAGIQQQQSGISVTTTPAPSPSVTQTSSTAGTLFGGANGGFAGVGVQQSQGAFGNSQGGISGGGFQQSQGGATFSTTGAPGTSSTTNIFLGGANGGLPGAGFPQAGGGNSFEGASVGGFQQSQGGGVYSTTGAPFFQSTTPSLSNGGGFNGIGFQQSQGGIGTSQGGSFSGAGFQQSQGGIFSTTPAPYLPPAAPTTTFVIGNSNGGFSGVGIQQSQGGIGLAQGGSQGGASGAPTTTFVIGNSNGGVSGVGIQQSQGGISLGQGGSQGGASSTGFQQSQGGAVFSTTGAPFFPSTTPLPNGGGFSGVGFQQSQGGIGVSSGGGFSGAGFQQSQGGVYSTTPAPFLPPATPTPTVLIGGKSNGGYSGIGFQQSQGGIGLGGGGGFAGFQQSQGGIGVSQGDLSGSGLQVSQGNIGLASGGGEFIYSTTASPSYSLTGSSRSIILRPQKGGGYPVVSTTTGGPIIISTLNQLGDNRNSFVVQGNANVGSKGSVSSTTTTERSYSGSSSGSSHYNPYTIKVGTPNFSYPPYVEITSNGSPLGHLKQQPYTQEPSHDYPRMRYQGKLLTGEVHIDDGLDGEQHESQQQGYGALSSHHQNYESPANVAEVPPNTPQEEHATGHLLNHPQTDETNPQHQHQFVGSSKQPIQDSQIYSSAHQQPDQIHQHHFERASSQPIVADEQSAHQQHPQQNDAHPASSRQHSAQQQVVHQHVSHHQQAHPQQSAFKYIVQEHQPIQRANYQSSNHNHNNLQFIPITPIHQEHAAPVRNQQPIHHNLVAEIRHQQLTPKQPPHGQVHRQQTEHHHPTESTHSKQQQVTESLEEPIEVSEVHSSTHQQPKLFQQQISTTDRTIEPYNSGSRQYKQRGAPLKYTQDQSLNVAPSEHTVYFNNNLEHTSARSQNLEIPPEPQSMIKEISAKNVDSSTHPIVTTTSQRIEETTQRQTYASVLAQGKPGILYAPPKPVGSNHSPGHKHHFIRFSADGSKLFSPSGRQVHLVMYSNAPRAIYPHQSQTHSIPTAPIEPAKQHIAVTNKGYQIQAQLPITRQSQIELSASNKPAPASEPQITRSQSHAASHQTSAHYEAISTTTPPETTTTKEHHIKQRGPQKYRNQHTHSAITLRSGRTYGDHRVIASSPAPSDGGAASESVQTRRIVVNHPFQTIQEVVEREPFTNIHQVTVNAPAKQVQHQDGLQEGQQKSAALRAPAPYKVAALLNHPHATLSFHHGGSH